MTKFLTWYLLIAATLVAVAASSVHAQASDRDTSLRLRNGDQLTGTLVELVPHTRVTIQLKTGTRVPVSLTDVEEESVPDFATVRLADGRSGSGHVVEYIAGDHLVLAGQKTRVRYEARSLASIAFVNRTEQVSGAHANVDAATPTAAASRSSSPDRGSTSSQSSPAQISTSSSSPALSDAVRQAALQALVAERADWAGRYTDVVGPTMATLVGVAGVVAGVGLLAAYEGSAKERCTQTEVITANSGRTTAGYRCVGDYVVEKKGAFMGGAAASLAIGGAALVTGIVLWSVRTSEGKQRENIDRIDNQLRLNGMSVGVQPWLDLRSGGMRIAGSF